MIKEGKFGVQEAICLTTITIASKSFYTSLGAVVRSVGTSGWYMTLISSVTALAAFAFIYLLLKRFPDKNIMDIYNIVFGKYIGFIFSALLCGWLLFIAVVDLREHAEVIKTYTLPLSPIGYLIGLFVFAVIVYCFLGLESIARFAKLSSYILLIGFIAVFVLVIPNYNLGRMYPLMGYGLSKTLFHGLTRSSAYGEVIIVAVFATSLQGPKHIKKIGYTSIALGGVIISMALLELILTFPYTVARELTAPFYVIASIIYYGRFVQRLESIFLFIWNITSLISVTALFYSSFLIYCHMFEINDKRPLVIPFSIILYMLVMLPEGIIDVAFKLIQFSREWGWAFYFIPPILALIVALLRKKTGGYSDA